VPQAARISKRLAPAAPRRGARVQHARRSERAPREDEARKARPALSALRLIDAGAMRVPLHGFRYGAAVARRQACQRRPVGAMLPRVPSATVHGSVFYFACVHIFVMLARQPVPMSSYHACLAPRYANEKRLY